MYFKTLSKKFQNYEFLLIYQRMIKKKTLIFCFETHNLILLDKSRRFESVKGQKMYNIDKNSSIWQFYPKCIGIFSSKFNEPFFCLLVFSISKIENPLATSFRELNSL